jgi:hypothetical protein
MSHYDLAFKNGQEDCLRSFSSGSTTLSASSEFNPPADMREAYEAGWNAAAAKHTARMASRERIGDVLIPIIVGVLFLGAGVAVTGFTITSGGGTVIIAYGAMVSGIGLIIKGVVSAIRGNSIEE